MGRQFRSEGGDYPQDVTRFRERVPEAIADNKDADSHAAANLAAQAELDLHHSQIDRAGREKPYQDITDTVPHPGRTADSRSQHVMPDEFPRGRK